MASEALVFLKNLFLKNHQEHLNSNHFPYKMIISAKNVIIDLEI